MVIVGVGTDIVEVGRIRDLVDRGGRIFLERWFRPAEVEYCISRNTPARHAAARFAAKEATLKSLRVPGTGPVSWREIEITRDEDGRPGVRMHGEMLAQADRVGITCFHVSIAHEASFATATVLAMSVSVGTG